MHETLIDLERLSALSSGSLTKGPPKALYDGAIFLHGWGTSPSPANAVERLWRSAWAGDNMATVVLSQVWAANPRGPPDSVVEEVQHDAVLDMSLQFEFPRFYNQMFALALQTHREKKFPEALSTTRQGTVDIFSYATRQRLQRDPDAEEYMVMMDGGRSGISDANRDEDGPLIPLQMFLPGIVQEAIIVPVHIDDEIRTLRGSDVHEMIRQELFDVNEEVGGKFPISALWVACNRGNAGVALALLEVGAEPNVSDHFQGCTPLHFLTRFEPEDVETIACALAAAGGDIEAPDKSRARPLEAALDPMKTFMPRSALPAVKALLALGACPYGKLRDAPMVVGQHDDITALPDCPMAMACKYRQVDILEVLIDRVEELQSSDAAGEELEKLFSQALRFEERGIPEPLKNADGMLAHYITTLKARCFLNAISEPVCPSLVQKNWLYANKDGSESSSVSRIVEYLLVPETVSFFAAKHDSPLLRAIRERTYDFVEPILERKAFPQSDLTDRRLFEALFETRNTELVWRFWRFGFVFGAETVGDKESFLHLAVANDWNVEQLSRLCDLVVGEDKSMDLSAQAQVHDERGASPFASAVIQGNLPVADYLARLSPVNDDIDRKQFKMDAPGSPECTLLGYCLGATADDLKLHQVKYLLKFKPAFRVSSTRGFMALTLGWKDWRHQRKRFTSPDLEASSSTAVLDLLLGHYSDKSLVNQPDSLGKTPLHYACATGSFAAVKRLTEAGAEINAMDHDGKTPLDCIVERSLALTNEFREKDETTDHLAQVDGNIVDVDIETRIYLQLAQFLRSKGASIIRDGVPGGLAEKTGFDPVTYPSPTSMS